MSLFRAIGRAIGGLARRVGRVARPVLPVVGSVVGGPAGAALTIGGGLLGSLVSPTIRRTIGGQGPQITTIPSSQLVSPPSPEEQGLLNNLHTLSRRILETPFRRDLYDRALADYDWAVNTLKGLSAGQLPQPFTQEIQHFFKEDLGQNLNELANRGIINTSVGSGAMMGAMERALQRRMQYIPTLAGIASSIPELGFRAYEFGARAPFEHIQRQAEIPLHLWKQLGGFRYGTPGQVVVREGSPGLLGPILGAAGQTIGSWAGQRVGSAVGSWFGQRDTQIPELAPSQAFSPSLPGWGLPSPELEPRFWRPPSRLGLGRRLSFPVFRPGSTFYYGGR